MSTEEELVKSFQCGNDEAFVSLYNRYKQLLYVFCVKMLRNAETARDAVQSVFLKIYEHRDQKIPPNKFRSWMFTIARNHCLTHLRDSRATFPFNEDMEESLIPSTEESCEEHEEVEIVNRSIMQLRADYREVLVLREYENLSYEEIAEITNLTESAVKSKLFRARRQLHELLRSKLVERN